MEYEKKYKQALSRAAFYNGELLTENQRKMLLDIFPELTMSEDERIRKALIEMIHDTTGDECEDCYHVSKESVLAWLEKQGKQKQTKLLICPTTLTITSGCMDTYHAKTTIAHLAPCA